MDRESILRENQKNLKNYSKETREFLNNILDQDSFVEMDTYSYSKELTNSEILGEGVVSGFGTINDLPIYVAFQNYNAFKGGIGIGNANKIIKCMEQAKKVGVPFMISIDSVGARIDEGVECLEAFGLLYKTASKLSGQIPLICVVKGQAIGSITYFANLFDFVIAYDKATFISASPLVMANKNDTIDKVGKIEQVKEYNYNISFIVKNDSELKSLLTDLFSYIPSNATELSISDCTDDLNRLSPELDNAKAADAFKSIVDNGKYLELSKDSAKGARTILAKIGGYTVGILALNPIHHEGRICPKGAKKICNFIQFLDSYSIPFISFVDLNGLFISQDGENKGLQNSFSSLIYTISNSNIPKVSVICNNCIGMAYTLFASKALGYDYSIAWKDSVISPVSDKIGAVAFYEDAILKSKDPNKERELVEKKYDEINASPIHAAKLGYVDNIIEPSHTRPYLISVLQMLLTKSEDEFKKHGKMPQ